VPVRYSEARLVRDARADSIESMWWDGRDRVLRWLDPTAGVVHLSAVAGGVPDATDPLVSPLERLWPAASGFVGVLGGRILLLGSAAAEQSEFARIGSPRDALHCSAIACDPAGNLVLGTGTPGDDESREGAIHLVRPDGAVTTLATGLGRVAGLAWDDERFYFSDESAATVYRARYAEGPDGELTDVEPLVSGRSLVGIARDVFGGFWSGDADEGGVVRWDVGGRITDELTLPNAVVTALAFGGPKLETLYLGTSRAALSEEERDDHPESGGVIAIETSTRGFETVPFAR
jgi:sugar lactone lactonase YvrE